MRTACVLVVLALLAVSYAENPSPLPTVRNTILSDAHACCSSSCSAEQKASLKARSDVYDGPDAQSTRQFAEKAISGECASGRSKRAPGDFVAVTCSPDTIDVANAMQTVTCVVNMKIAQGIMMSSLSASSNFNGTYRSVYPDNYYYYDQNATSTMFTRTYAIKIPRYSVYGPWYINAYGYSAGYNTYIQNGTTYFTVLKTTNDVAPPKLTSISPAVININDINKGLNIAAFDDVSGISSVNIYIQNTTTTIASASWYAMYMNGGYAGVLNLTAFLQLSVWYPPIIAGTYNLTVYLNDAAGFSVSLSSVQLSAMGLQSTVTFATSNCPAGSARPYNTAGACTTCPAGMYAPAGAFVCMSCPGGTYNFGTGASLCTPCPTGFSGIGASWACVQCSPGTYASSQGQSFCYPCQPGYNVTRNGATSCGYCPSGTFSSGGQATCTPCPVGTYSNGFAGYCPRCTPGTFSNSVGASSCSACPAGTYSGLGQTSCTSCPAPRVLSSAGSNSQLNCYQP